MPQNEYQYHKAIIALIFVYFGLMYYGFDREWADQSWALAVIDFVGSIVPLVRNLKIAPDYSNFWGVTYAGAWLLGPFTFYLGWMAAKHMDPENVARYSKWSKLKLCLVMTFAFFLCIYGFYMQVYPDHRDWRQNAMMGSFFGVVYSGGCVMGIPFVFAYVIKVFHRFCFSKTENDSHLIQGGQNGKPK